jgi:hypothetical protein
LSDADESREGDDESGVWLYAVGDGNDGDRSVRVTKINFYGGCGQLEWTKNFLPKCSDMKIVRKV